MPLTDYATRSQCWTCDLPPEILAEIHAARIASESGGRKIGPDTIIAWLVGEKGYKREEIRRGSLNFHLQSRHWERV